MKNEKKKFGIYPMIFYLFSMRFYFFSSAHLSSRPWSNPISEMKRIMIKKKLSLLTTLTYLHYSIAHDNINSSDPKKKKKKKQLSISIKYFFFYCVIKRGGNATFVEGVEKNS